MSRRKPKKPELTPEQLAVHKLFEAYVELKHLGWLEPQYFNYPTEGDVFLLIEFGSCGIHRAVRRAGSDVCWVDHQWPSTPVLLRKVTG
jgi:hypothetical protein